MQKIQLKKLELTEVNILKNQLHDYYSFKKINLSISSKDTEKFINELLIVDIAESMYYNFGTKIIRNLNKNTYKNKTFCNLNISIAEAVILYAVCNAQSLRNNVEEFTMNKIAGIIDQQLKSIQ